MNKKTLISLNGNAENTMNSAKNLLKGYRKNMKIYSGLLAVATVFACNQASISFAQTEFQGSLNNVSITDATGSNAPPVADFTYSKEAGTFTFDASPSSDSDGSVTQYKWDFGAGIVSESKTASFTPSNNSPFSATLTVVDDGGGVSLKQQSIVVGPPLSVAVNFQPAGVPEPEGYQIDTGANYDDNKGYGWTISPRGWGDRDSNSNDSPDQAHDTFIMALTGSVWEYKIPNGEYGVTISVGDPKNLLLKQSIQVEGVPFLENEDTNGVITWLTRTNAVNVSDGRLTVTFVGTQDKSQFCWLKITSE